jgi:glycosyltransferase involved in cell wall biosynthesis
VSFLIVTPSARSEGEKELVAPLHDAGLISMFMGGELDEIEGSGLFDVEYYAASHPEALASGDSPLAYFARVGLAAGHKPSANFDPALYFEMYPDVAASGLPALLHYIRDGRREGRRLQDRAAKLAMEIEASGIFDANFYAQLYPRVPRSEALDHFVRIGMAEGRRPSLQFDPAGYLTENQDVAAANVDPVTHFIERGRFEERTLPKPRFDLLQLNEYLQLLSASGLFDAEFYLTRNSVAKRTEADPLLHYLVEGSITFQDPSPKFSTAAYVIQNPGLLISGEIPLLHFLSGSNGDDRLFLSIDDLRAGQSQRGLWMSRQNETLARFAETSFRARYGLTSGAPPKACYLLDAIAALQPSLRIEEDQPDVSVVVLNNAEIPALLACLDSLARQRSRFSVEVILVEKNSSIPVALRPNGTIPWLHHRQIVEAPGSLKALRKAGALARGRYIAFLSSEVSAVEGWLDELVGSFRLFPKAGLVGSKHLSADGHLLGARGSYSADGGAVVYSQGVDAGEPVHNFARQVDWISHRSFAAPTELWNSLVGLAEEDGSNFLEDSELALRVRKLGYDIWLQPLSCVIAHYGAEDKSSVSSGFVAAPQDLNRVRPSKAHAPLSDGPTRKLRPFDARIPRRKTMLVVDAHTHTPDRDAASAISWKMLQAYRDLGFDQTFVAFDDFRPRGSYTAAYQRIGVEVLYAPFFNTLEEVLQSGRSYDYVWVSRYHVAQGVVESVRRLSPLSRIIFVPADLHYLRLQRQAYVTHDTTLLMRAARVQTDELLVFSQVDCSVPHSTIEKTVVLKELPRLNDNLVVFPWIAEPIQDSPAISSRKHVMFLGNYTHAPNEDAVAFFMTEIWPLLSLRLPLDAKFLVVGDAPTDSVKAFESERCVVTGQVSNIEPCFEQARVFVAPLRFGAGIKGKLIESLSNGVPTVATTIATEGIGLVDGEHCLVADTPEAISQAILRLYAEPETWERLRLAGLRFVEENYSWRSALALCQRTLDVADATWLSREARVRAALLGEFGARQEL